MELATAKLAISTLSPVINKLGTYVSDSYFGGDVTMEEMNILKVFARFKISELIRVAELDHSDRFRELLEDLLPAAFEVEDVLDLYEYKQIEYQVSSSPNLIKKYIPIFKEKFAFMLPKTPLRISLENLQKFVDQLEKLPPFINFVGTEVTQHNHKSPQASTCTQTTSNPLSPYFGRAKQYDIIIEFLLEESHVDSIKGIKRVPTIAIQGLGGSGKTLTAQHAYHDDKIKNYFDLRVWVHVSRSFDVLRLTKEIIESTKHGECPQMNNLNELQEKLKQSVSKRNKFLLVLDDIWCHDKMQWDQLLSPLNKVGGKGSKIIITTRTKEVAYKLQVEKVILLEELKTEDCWSILKHYAFNNHEKIIEDQELVDVGNQIISKAKFSPLALRIVGRTLFQRTSVNEWNDILKRDMVKVTKDVLLFSFQHLPSHLQRCFAYCSLFPKGYRFSFKDQPLGHPLLIDLWIAQGFIENSSDQLTLEEEGNRYIDELISCSFFEKISDYYFIIHDLLHDLAEEVSKKLCQRIEHPESIMDIPATCIHLSFCPSNPIVDYGKIMDLSNIFTYNPILNYWKSMDLSNIFKCRNIRTLIIFKYQWWSRNDLEENIQNLTKLRTLHVEFDMPMKVLNIDKLKQLRYLHVQYNKKLPSSLTKLYHLQFFYLHTDQARRLQDRAFLKEDTLPKDFGNLTNLRTLKFYGDIELDYLNYNSKMIDIEKLTSLQTLKAFHPEKDGGSGMIMLKNLSLCGSLFLNLENVKSKMQAAEAMLNKKKKLNELTFKWSSTSSSTDNSNTFEEVLEGLEPHPNIERLSIKGYQGVKVANWMEKENWFQHLTYLKLSSCKSLKEVPFLPPCLEELIVKNCDELMRLPPLVNTLCDLKLENCPKLMLPSVSNKSLYKLCIKRCSAGIQNQAFIELPSLIKLKVLELEGFPNLQTLPNLSPTVWMLWIEDCPKLTCLGNLQNCTSLSDLRIKKCPMLMRDKQRLLVEGAVKGDIAKPLSSSITCIETDEPLLVLVLVPQQAFSSVRELNLYGLQRPFPPLLEDHFHQLSSLYSLVLNDFTTLPNLEKLSSLQHLQLKCPDVERLSNLPSSLRLITLFVCPKLVVNYKEGGQLHRTISHVHLQILSGETVHAVPIKT